MHNARKLCNVCTYVMYEYKQLPVKGTIISQTICELLLIKNFPYF